MTPKKSFHKGGMVYSPLWRRFSASLTAPPRAPQASRTHHRPTPVSLIFRSRFYLFHLISPAGTSLRCFSITKIACHRSYKFVGEEGTQKCVVCPAAKWPTQNHNRTSLIYSDTHYLPNNNVLVYVFCFYND